MRTVNLYQERVEYEGRVTQASEILTNKEAVKENILCWKCVKPRGDLDLKLDAISFELQTDYQMYNLNKQDNYGQHPDKAKEMEIKLLIEDELREEKQLKKEKELAQNQLVQTINTYRNYIAKVKKQENEQLFYNQKLDSYKMRLEQIEEKIQKIPKTQLQVWSDFFQIKHCESYSSIGFYPIAILGEEPFKPNCADDSNIICGLRLLTFLVNRIFNQICGVPEFKDTFTKREFRLVSNPPSLQHRKGLTDLSLLPFIENKLNENFGKALLIFAQFVNTLFDCFDYLQKKITNKISDFEPVFSIQTKNGLSSDFYINFENLALDPKNPGMFN